jgi:hypothetical protein
MQYTRCSPRYNSRNANGYVRLARQTVPTSGVQVCGVASAVQQRCMAYVQTARPRRVRAAATRRCYSSARRQACARRSQNVVIRETRRAGVPSPVRCWRPFDYALTTPPRFAVASGCRRLYDADIFARQGRRSATRRHAVPGSPRHADGEHTTARPAARRLPR